MCGGPPGRDVYDMFTSVYVITDEVAELVETARSKGAVEATAGGKKKKIL